MPVIQNYTARNVDGKVTQGGIQAPVPYLPAVPIYGAETVGRSASQFGDILHHATNAVVNIRNELDVLQGYRDVAVARGQARDLMDSLASQGKPVGEEVAAFLEDQYDTIVASRKTRQSRLQAEAQYAYLQNDVLGQARARDSKLVADEAKNTIKVVQRENGIRLQGNPDNLEAVVAEQNQMIDSLSAPEGIKAGLKMDLNASAAASAAQGLISNNPMEAKAALEAGYGSKYLTPEARIQMINYAGVRVEGLKREARAQRAERRKIIKETAQDYLAETLLRLRGTDPSKRLTSADVTAAASKRNLDGTLLLSGPQINQLYNLVEKEAEGKSAKTSAAVTVQLTEGADSLSESKLSEMFLRGEIGHAEYVKAIDIARNGSKLLKTKRKTTVDSIEGVLGLSEISAKMWPDRAKAKAEVINFLDAREKNLREHGKDPVIEYYGTDQVDEDIKRVAGPYLKSIGLGYSVPADDNGTPTEVPVHENSSPAYGESINGMRFVGEDHPGNIDGFILEKDWQKLPK